MSEVSISPEAMGVKPNRIFYHAQIGGEAFNRFGPKQAERRELAAKVSARVKAGEKPADARKAVQSDKALRSTIRAEAKAEFKLEQELLPQVFDRLLNNIVANTEVVRGENGEAFPVTHVNITDLARKLYKTYSGQEPPQVQSTEAERKSRPFQVRNDIEFVFPSAPDLQNGHPFTFVEQTMNRTMEALPKILNDLKNGRVPVERVIYTLGAVTNRDWGQVSPEYVQKITEDPYGTVGRSYAEYVGRVLPSHSRVLFSGNSMGASYAMKTAEAIIANGRVTQDRAQVDALRPYLQILLDAPVSLNSMHMTSGKLRNKFIGQALSFIARQWLNYPKTPINIPGKENKLLAWLNGKLRQRGVFKTGEDHVQVITGKSDQIKKDQETLKKDALKHLVDSMAAGVAYDPHLIVNIRRGIHDPLVERAVYDQSDDKAWKQEAGERLNNQNETRHSLGGTLVKRPEGSSIREGAIDSAHIFPYFNQGAMRQWERAMHTILQLRAEKVATS